MENKTVVGKFVWHDIMTPNVDVAASFYSKLIGWDVVPQEFGGEPYMTIMVHKKPIGGFFNPKNETQPQWTAYITVENVDHIAKMAEKLGGKILQGPAEAENMRFCTLEDPQGVRFNIVTPGESDSEEISKPGLKEFCWNELSTSDPESAMKFYGELFKWTFEANKMENGTYYLCKVGDQEVAGLVKLSPNIPAPPHWLYYIYIEDLDGITKKAVDLGAEVMMPPTPIPDMGRFSVIKDPVGAVVGLYSD